MRLATSLICLVPAVAVGAESAPAPSTTSDWELPLKALGFVVAVIVAYIQARNLYLTTRTSVKTDLEILKLLDATDANYQKVKTAVDLRIADLYAPKQPVRWALVGIGFVWACGFSYLTFRLVQPDFSWLSLLTGYQALAGVAFIFMGIKGRTSMRRFVGFDPGRGV